LRRGEGGYRSTKGGGAFRKEDKERPKEGNRGEGEGERERELSRGLYYEEREREKGGNLERERTRRVHTPLRWFSLSLTHTPSF